MEAQNEAQNKKAGSGPAPLSCLPLHQPSIFPGYSSNRFNGERFPENFQKKILSEFQNWKTYEQLPENRPSREPEHSQAPGNHPSGLANAEKGRYPEISNAVGAQDNRCDYQRMMMPNDCLDAPA